MSDKKNPMLLPFTVDEIKELEMCVNDMIYYLKREMPHSSEDRINDLCKLGYKLYKSKKNAIPSKT